jgi:hypothetical protein
MGYVVSRWCEAPSLTAAHGTRLTRGRQGQTVGAFGHKPVAATCGRNLYRYIPRRRHAAESDSGSASHEHSVESQVKLLRPLRQIDGWDGG